MYGEVGVVYVGEVGVVYVWMCEGRGLGVMKCWWCIKCGVRVGLQREWCGCGEVGVVYAGK